MRCQAAGWVPRDAVLTPRPDNLQGWDEIPEEQLGSHYAKAVNDLDEHDLSMLAAWHASMEVGMPVALTIPSRSALWLAS